MSIECAKRLTIDLGTLFVNGKWTKINLDDSKLSTASKDANLIR